MRKFKFIDANFHPKIHSQFTTKILPKFKEIGWYIDHANLLTLLQHAYFTKLSNLPEQINHDEIFLKNNGKTKIYQKVSDEKNSMRIYSKKQYAYWYFQAYVKTWLWARTQPLLINKPTEVGVLLLHHLSNTVQQNWHAIKNEREIYLIWPFNQS